MRWRQESAKSPQIIRQFPCIAVATIRNQPWNPYVRAVKRWLCTSTAPSSNSATLSSSQRASHWTISAPSPNTSPTKGLSTASLVTNSSSSMRWKILEAQMMWRSTLSSSLSPPLKPASSSPIVIQSIRQILPAWRQSGNSCRWGMHKSYVISATQPSKFRNEILNKICSDKDCYNITLDLW